MNCTKKRRIRALLLVLAVVVVLLASVLYIFVESGHDCIGKSCPVCAQLNVCRNMLRAPGLLTATATVAGLSAERVYMAAYARQNTASGCTLIALKVKLSD